MHLRARRSAPARRQLRSVGTSTDTPNRSPLDEEVRAAGVALIFGKGRKSAASQATYFNCPELGFRIGFDAWERSVACRVRGFTLIELLVVVAVIALLIAIVAPSLSAARDQAKRTACLSNMRNMGVAAALYANDNRDQFPLNRGLTQAGGWLNTLLPYAGDKLLYRCPSDRSDDWFNPSDTPAQQLINDRLNSYAINIYISPRQLPPPGSIDMTPRYGYSARGLIRYSSSAIHFGEFVDTSGVETSGDHIHADHWTPNALTGMPLSPPGTEVALRRHRGRENYTYADGHAATHAFEQTFAYDSQQTELLRDEWNPAFRVPNP